ncbi:hypothetical protein G7Y31_04415 [Corynebacterium lizhenjunii]|uniref:Uncharacterized protein n=1 Tax=Corynebacterium lizhenjunii TaxID=2709394 RepID=A0A7T0KFQ0_9CORY|nr:hypothetical protein [Corynebacterium lizhenjunii]QPK79941.1 hypothetical protein G7Y31_04415 [Corynebacterium lizhenjunii]
MFNQLDKSGLYLLIVGVACSIFAGISYTVAGSQNRGILQLGTTVAFLGIVAAASLSSLGKSLKRSQRAQRYFTIAFFAFVLAALIGIWLWMVPAAQGPSWLLVAGFSVLQAVPFYGFGLKLLREQNT